MNESKLIDQLISDLESAQKSNIFLDNMISKHGKIIINRDCSIPRSIIQVTYNVELIRNLVNLLSFINSYNEIIAKERYDFNTFTTKCYLELLKKYKESIEKTLRIIRERNILLNGNPETPLFSEIERVIGDISYEVGVIENAHEEIATTFTY